MRKRFLILATVCMLALSGVSVMAAESPTADKVIDIEIGGQTSGKEGNTVVDVPGGKIQASTGRIEIGKEVTFTALPDTGNTFSKWVITGDYEIVSGSLEDGTITIIPHGPISIDVVYLDKDGKVITADKGEGDTSNTSPQTGAAAGTILVTLLGSGVIAMTSRKKLSE